MQENINLDCFVKTKKHNPEDIHVYRGLRRKEYVEEIITLVEKVSKVKPAMPITSCTGAL